MKKGCLKLLLFLLYLPAVAQIGGTATYRFLSLTPSALQNALGGKQFVSMPYDLLQNFSNPALISPGQTEMLGLNYANHITDINYGNAGYVFKIPKAGYIFTGITYLNYGRFTAANADGEITGKFTASESALNIGYAYRIASGFSVGANIKWIHSALAEYRSDGLAFDIGLHYQNNFSEWALVFRNFGFQLSTYNGTREPLPFEIDLGFAQLLAHAPLRLYVTFENLQKPAIAFVNTAHNRTDPSGNEIPENINLIHHFFRHLIVGAELFPRKRFNIRLGFNFRRSAELGLQNVNFSSGFTAGFGLRLRRFRLNYAYAQYHFAGNSNMLGLTVFLNPSKYEKNQHSH